MPDANGYPYPWEPGYRVGQGTANPATPAPNASNIATGQPVSTVQPTGVQVPAAQNIDPQASAPQTAATPATSNTAGAAGATGAGGANSVNAGQTAPGTNLPRPDPIAGIGNPAVDAITAPTRQALADANTQVVQNWKDLQDTQQQYNDALANNNIARLSQITPILQAQQAKSIELQRTLQTAQTNFATSVDGALKSATVDPAQADALRAQAVSARSSANEADTRAQVLADGADSQKQLVLAQGAQAANAALLDKANADAVNAKTPQDIETARQQGNVYAAQANQINSLLPGLLDKQKADTTLTQHQVGLTDAESEYNQALAKSATADAAMKDAQTRLLVPAQAGLATAQGAEAQAQAQFGIPAAAALNQAQAGQIQLGPMYGLQQRIDAYKQLIGQVQNHVFGNAPPGTDPDQLKSQADDLLTKYGGNLLQQSITAAMGGTTPYAASVAAQNANQNQFQTQAAMWNQSSQSAAARANAFAGTAGSALGSMLSANQWMPKGSTAMGDAFQYFLDQMKTNMGGPQAFMPGAQPQAAPLPAFLQAFAAGHQAGQAQANGQPSGGQAAPTVNINVNGQPQTGTTLPFTGPPAQVPSNPGPGQNAVAGQVPQGTLLSGGAQPQPQQSPQDAFAQGLANNAPGPMPNYLSSLVDPMSMLTTARGLYNQGPGAGTPTAGSLLY